MNAAPWGRRAAADIVPPQVQRGVYPALFPLTVPGLNPKMAFAIFIEESLCLILPPSPHVFPPLQSRKKWFLRNVPN